MAVYSLSLPKADDDQVRDVAKAKGVSPEEACRYLIRVGLKCEKKGGK
jgi:hypothetical protein